jgi:hypothetical protein
MDPLYTTPTIAIDQTPTITAGAYVAGDAVGGLLTFANAARSQHTGVVTTVVVSDLAAQGVDLELVLFGATFTATADNAPFDPSDADLLNRVGVIPIDNHFAFNDNGISQRRNVGLWFQSQSENLYGQLVTRGAPTYASTSDLRVTLVVALD